jgi:Protein of unknown function (DUF3602)
VSAPAEGEGYSTGRGGAANVHPQGEKQTNGVAKVEKKKDDGHVASLGLAYVSQYFMYNC